MCNLRAPAYNFRTKDRIGLLPIRQLGQFASLWSQLNENKLTGFPQGSRSVKVKYVHIYGVSSKGLTACCADRCVGVWDTVGSIYFGKSGTFQLIDSLSILDSKFPACIENAYHALAFHENRRLFQVTLWSSLPASSQKLKQVCWMYDIDSTRMNGFTRWSGVVWWWSLMCWWRTFAPRPC